MKLSTLAAPLQGKILGPDVSYTGFSLDSRHIKPGQLFIAILGDRFDGHDFIKLAKQQGAAAALVDRPMAIDLPLLQVLDTRKALGALAKYHRHQFSIPIIALTGSCGKTTTKQMIVAILHESGPVLTNHKNFNNDIGVPLTLLNLTAEHRYAVIEMGANHLGEIAYLSQMTNPDVALITNIEPAHLQGFGSMAGIAQAKAEIFSGLPEKGVAVINADDNFAPTWQKQLASYRVVGFGLSNKADFFATHIQMDAQGKASFILHTPCGEECTIGLTLPGQHHVMNALAAAAAASQLGVGLAEIKAGLEKAQPVPGRINIITTKTGATIIDDSYNANPSSVAAGLKLLAHYPGRHIFVMGDMSELGENADRYHREIGQLAKELNLEEVYTCGALSALTAEEFGANAKHYTYQEELIPVLKRSLQNKVTVLIKGSRSARMDQVVAALTEDDALW
ncbi:MAG: UDP-N-acetylmuramoyl-tripeptide--D-alanyl-D-alanine ligase [Candidatus Aquirickettsiella gammari]